MRRSSPEERGLKFGHTVDEDSQRTSLLTRGAWIEMSLPMFLLCSAMSLLTRGAWIEIKAGQNAFGAGHSRSSPEERGLKLLVLVWSEPSKSRSSPEERGLKFSE